MATSKERERDLRKRLLQDIAELQTNPYPNITLHVDDGDITTACLILTPQDWRPLHLTVEFPTGQPGQLYPLKPPRVRMDSAVRHPNVYGSYICASILNTTEGYTPAYTLKAIAIQLLSFFGSGSVEQEYGGIVHLARFRDESSYMFDGFKCSKCTFGNQTYHITPASSLVAESTAELFQPTSTTIRPDRFFISLLPNEILLQIIDNLDFEDLTNFTRSWSRMSQLVTNSNVIRKRELRCFLLKESFLDQKLGIGIHLGGNGRYREVQSEFDLLSQQAYKSHCIRRSVQGLHFEHWLPLPISHGHWRRVKADAYSTLALLSKETRIGDNALVIFAFMNSIIAKLNSDLEIRGGSKSTLLHASDKAIESYFHLFHLLLCLATGPGGEKIVSYANSLIKTFMAGNTDKAFVPNLGNLLVALLISDIEPNEPLMRAIVKEAITRNVVWVLDTRGAGMAELAYLETDQVSKYRLKKTYQGSRVSYRILMFSELFRRTARPKHSTTTSASSASSSEPPKRRSLVELRDELFARHGAPPLGAAAKLAAEVRRLQEIDDFPSFLKEMGVSWPGRATFTAVLRESVRDSADKGYHVFRPSMNLVAGLRIIKDTGIDPQAVAEEIRKAGYRVPGPDEIERARQIGRFGFFPDKKRSQGN
ncbi:SUMO-conjugating enzyme ubc9 [Rhypophila decipiens]|uniref:SUMO-conjugating enzyme ubc9 n=1 Tax=Rhypophila decipiens TaxID=261697 RepID=A0AAN6XZE1_9PEZI|nr:SUMO-conjugating enzyme ubc9 [Rhypophila decipiens]